MTPDEFADQVEDVIENRPVKVWEIYDLRLLVRLAKKNGRVTSTDLLILKMSGVPKFFSPEPMKKVVLPVRQAALF